MRLLIATAAVVFVAAAATPDRGSAVCAATFDVSTAAGVTDDQVQRGQMRIRFAEMDTNGDGRVTRQEWRGSARSFEVHDWNNDGVLSGDEVRVGATWPNRAGVAPDEFNDWSQERFRWLDANRDNRVTRAEWRYDAEDFFRVDRNGDGVLTLREFLVGEVDDDRGDRFADLDLDNDNRISRTEWHGSLVTFNWLDRNRDGVLSRTEAVGSGALGTGGVGTPVAPRTVVVSARQAWIDSGVDVRLNDLVSITATGTILFSGSRTDVARPGGVGAGATGSAPRPDLPIGALLAKIGADGQPFLVGASLDSHRANRPGRLYLGVNDDVLTDNSGQFRATVSIVRR
jgi:Ca2+-binding EF-hand superfamily protein